MKIGHQSDGRPASVFVWSSCTPILTDERPPLGADGPLRRIERLSDLSMTSWRKDITSSHKSMLRWHPGDFLPRLNVVANLTRYGHLRFAGRARCPLAAEINSPDGRSTTRRLTV